MNFGMVSLALSVLKFMSKRIDFSAIVHEGVQEIIQIIAPFRRLFNIEI